MAQVIADPGPDNERFLTEGFKHLPAEPAKVDATDARLKLLRGEHSRFLELRSPMKASIWLALLRPTKAVLHDVEMQRRFVAAQQGLSAGEFVAPDVPAIVQIGNQLVARAMEGDMTAIAQIGDRIEGKAGLRVGDADEDDPARQKQSQQITEDIMRRLVGKRLGEKKPGDDANVIDVKAETIPPPTEESK
jgi:hypothetical protein